jgi:hypothetical protein
MKSLLGNIPPYTNALLPKTSQSTTNALLQASLPTRNALLDYIDRVPGRQNIMLEMADKKTVYRDSVDGQFVTKREAEQRPRETERERVPVGKPSKKK